MTSVSYSQPQSAEPPPFPQRGLFRVAGPPPFDHVPHGFGASSALVEAMGKRRPRSHQPSGSAAGLGYGLATIFVAGLAFVDSFNLVLHRHHHQSQCSSNNPRQQHLGHAGASSSSRLRAASFRGKACSSCSASSPRNGIPDASPSRRRTTAGQDGASKRTGTDCVTRTRASASKIAAAAADRPSITRTPASSANGKHGEAERGSGRSGKAGAAANNSRPRSVGEKRTSLEQKQRLQRSIGEVEERAVSRGQLVSSFALMGAATALLGASGMASASTEVCHCSRLIQSTCQRCEVRAVCCCLGTDAHPEVRGD